MNRTQCRLTVLLAALLLMTPAQAVAQDDFARIREAMSKLSTLVGEWDATYVFHNPDGSTTRQSATYSIAEALDHTYLQWHVTRFTKAEPPKTTSMIIFTTFNPTTHRYDETYFYSRWAMRVTETGEFDEARKEFTTTAFIPLEDGKRDENVRTVLNLKHPNRLAYTHYSRYNDEKVERMDLEVILVRRSAGKTAKAM